MCRGHIDNSLAGQKDGFLCAVYVYSRPDCTEKKKFRGREERVPSHLADCQKRQSRQTLTPVLLGEESVQKD